jgi:imidazolonepropionase-like amidohydrolase
VFTVSFFRSPFSIVLLLAATLSPAFSFAQDSIETPIAITHVNITTTPGNSIENATILIDGERIVAVGKDIDVPAAAQTIDGSGLYAYAGFIDAGTHMGIAEKNPSKETMERLRENEYPVKNGPRTSMQLANRNGVWPHLGVNYFYSQDSKALENYRKAGFTSALVTPHPNILSGAGSLLNLSDTSLRNATIAPDITQIVGFGDLRNVSYGGARTYPGSQMGVTALLRQTYLDGNWYRKRHALYELNPQKVKKPEHDPVLEAMGTLIDREQMWIFSVDSPNEIHHALNLAEEFNQKIAILGGKEAWKVAERLAKENVPVIVSLDWEEKPKLAPKKPSDKKKTTYTTASWTPEFENDYFEAAAVREERIRLWTEQVNNLQFLINAGVQVALTSKDLDDTAALLKNGKTALEENLTADQLLAALTTGPAALFGASTQVGSLTQGSLANITLLTKPFGEEEAKVRHTLIQGKQFTFAVTEGSDDEEEDEGEDGEESEDEEKDESAEEEEDESGEEKHTWIGETAADRTKPFETGGSVLLRNATVLTVTKGILQNTDVLVINGKIRSIGKIQDLPSDVKIIDLTGYWLSPGIIDPHSHAAVTGINEWTQSISSEVRQADVVDHTQLGIHRALAGGVTTIHTMHGSANSMGGQNAVLKLKYNTSPRQMLVTSGPRIVKFALGENVTRGRPIPRFPNSRMGVESVMRHGFNAALEYQKEWKAYGESMARGQLAEIPRRDLRLEALSDIMNGGIWVHSHCYRGDEMLRLLQVAEDYGFRVATLQHVLEGYRVAPEMYAHGVGGSTFSDWWSYKKEAFDAIPYNAAMMMKAGIVTSINSDSADLIRHLNLEAGKMMRFGGLSAEDTMKLITINPAIQIGLDNRIGSIEVGKDGDFAVFTLHPLNTFSKNVMTIIEGEVFFKDESVEIDGSTPGPADDSVPAPPRSLLNIPAGQNAYAIARATVHPISQDPIENGTVYFKDGKIAAVGKSVNVPNGVPVIDGSGLHVYPGLINAASQLGLSEISALAQTVDHTDVSMLQPELRSLSAVNPHSEHIPVSLCEGITLSQIIPNGGVVSGRASAVQLTGWTMPEMLRDGETALVVDLPVLPLNISKEDKEKRVKEHQATIETVEKFFRDAQHYAKIKPTNPNLETNVRFEAMLPYVQGTKSVLLRAQSYKEILQAVQFADTFNLKATILGGGEAWKCAGLLAEKNIPVIITSVFTIPRSPHAPFDSFYANAAHLEKAGVVFAIASSGTQYVRQTPLHAGFSVAYGLSETEAVKSVTLNAAKIIGVDDEVGSLDVGKIADVIITTGNPLQASTRTIGCFIGGKPVELTSLHEKSFEKFSDRPDPGLTPTQDLKGPAAMRTK